ncbi:hypothetical protein [Teichococcus aestuarii]|uniref:hypothetical protein n=1 Tax=Teichococcus aestuarii TaxID=568898 RepID=UPI0036223EF4
MLLDPAPIRAAALTETLASLGIEVRHAATPAEAATLLRARPEGPEGRCLLLTYDGPGNILPPETPAHPRVLITPCPRGWRRSRCGASMSRRCGPRPRRTRSPMRCARPGAQPPPRRAGGSRSRRRARGRGGAGFRPAGPRPAGHGSARCSHRAAGAAPARAGRG